MFAQKRFACRLNTTVILGRMDHTRLDLEAILKGSAEDELLLGGHGPRPMPLSAVSGGVDVFD